MGTSTQPDLKKAMKKILRKRNGKLVEVYAFAVRYRGSRDESHQKEIQKPRLRVLVEKAHK